MSIPNIATLPEAPNRGDAPADFSAKADAFVAAIPPMVTQTNAVVAAINVYAPTIDGAKGAADAAAASAQSAAAYAAAAGASAGIGLLGNPGDSLQVAPGRKGVRFGPSDGNVGDIKISVKNPGPLWFPANGGIRAQSSAPTLFAAIGIQSPNVGQQWSTITSGITGTIVDMASNQSTGVVVAILAGTAGAAMRSLDYGMTWSSISLPATVAMNAIACDGNGNWLVVIAGTAILKSTDDASTWSTVTTGDAGYSKVAMSVDGTCIATYTASSTLVKYSTDFGLTWTTKLTGTTAVHAAVATDGKGVWIVAAGTSIRRSVDNGLTWVQVLGTTYAIQAIATDRNGNWCMSGSTAASNTYKSADGGLTWFTIAGSGTATITDITCVLGFFVLIRSIAPQILLLSAASDVVTFTVPAGGTLTGAQRVTNSGNGIINVGGTSNANTLQSVPIYNYDVGTQFRLPDFPVANGLQAWIKAGLVQIYTPTAFATQNVNFTFKCIYNDEQGTIVAGGDFRSIAYCEPANGIAWNLANITGNSSVTSIAGNGGGIWLATTDSASAGKLLRSTDNARNFTQMVLSLDGGSGIGITIRKVLSGSGGVWICIGSDGKLYRSTNNGDSWTSIATAPALNANSVIATNRNGTWLVTSGVSTVFRSTDNGLTFGAAIATVAESVITDIQMPYLKNIALIAWNAGDIGMSVTGGQSWLTISTWNSSLRVNKLAVNGVGDVIAVNTAAVGMLKYSANYGAAWSSTGFTPSNLVTDMAAGTYSPWIVGINTASPSIVRSTSSRIV